MQKIQQPNLCGYAIIVKCLIIDRSLSQNVLILFILFIDRSGYTNQPSAAKFWYGLGVDRVTWTMLMKPQCVGQRMHLYSEMVHVSFVTFFITQVQES